MTNYNINFTLLTRRTTAPFLRSTSVKAMVSWLMTSIQSVHLLFTQFVEDKRVEKYTTGQTFLLEIYLNYFFDRTLNRIYIRHVEEISEYDFFVSEGQNPAFDYQVSENHSPQGYSYFLGEGNRNLDVDFLVYVPTTTLAANEARIRANIQKYKLVGKRFKFITI